MTRPSAVEVLADGFLGHVLDSALLSDAEGRVRYANPAATTLFGLTADVLREHQVSHLVAAPPNEVAALLAAIDAGVAESGSWTGPIPRAGRSGASVTTAARVSTVAVEGQAYRLWLEADGGQAAAEARLALAVAAGRMAVWDFDLASDRVTGSPALFRLMGFPPDAEPDTDEIRSRYHLGDRERLQAEGRAALARGERFVESEFRYLWPDGSVHWVLLRAEALLDTVGRPTRALGVVMDITERKRAEEGLRAEQVRLKLAQDAAGIGVWDWDLRTGTTTWSPEIHHLLGLARDAPPRFRTWFKAVHRDDRARASAAIRASTDEARPFSVDFRLRGATAAAPRWIRSRGVPVMDEGGKPSRFVGINVDVSDEHRREDRLLGLAHDLRGAAAEMERERDRIGDLSNDLFAVVGEAGGVTAFNPAWTRLLGRDGSPGGRPFLDLVDPQDHAAITAALTDARSGEPLVRVEARLDPAGRDPVWVAWAMASENGTVYAVGRDVTLDKAREAALVQTQKMEALGQLTGGIAHDFNNLLQAVSGYLELIRSKPGDPALVARWAEVALLASGRGTRLTGQLLAFSRVQQIEVAAVSVGAVLADTAELLERTLGTAARIRIAVPPEPLGILADRTQFETALLNLAINARDAMPEGGDLSVVAEAVTVARDVDLAPGAYVAITVTDTGLGMPAEVARRAFDPFFTTKGVGKGTGLGLSQVYGMARHAGGVARIDSRPGRGTSVSMLLRRAEPPEADPGREAAAVAPAPTRASVLVVDDDADVRSLLGDMLATLGYATRFASDGPAALAAIEGEPPDLVLMDFAMPGMTGAEAARAALARHPGLRLVFASGHADTGDIDAAVGTAVPRLRKPFRMGELASLLSGLLSEGSPAT